MVAATTSHLPLDDLELLQQATVNLLQNSQDPTLYQRDKTNVVFQIVQQYTQPSETVIRFFCVTASAATIQPVTLWDNLVQHVLVGALAYESLTQSSPQLSTMIQNITISKIEDSPGNTELNNSNAGSNEGFAALSPLDAILIAIVTVGFVALLIYICVLYLYSQKELSESKQESSLNNTTVDSSNDVGQFDSRDDDHLVDTDIPAGDNHDVRIHVVEGNQESKRQHHSAAQDEQPPELHPEETSLNDVVFMVQNILRKSDYRDKIITPLADRDDEGSLPFDESPTVDDSLFQFDGSIASESFALVASSGHSTVCSNPSKS